MAELESRHVYTGIWLNISKGPVLGGTITASTQTGTLIVALLAILCSSAMAHLWQIVTFLVHQGRADTKAHDGLFRQQQALLRTMPSPATVFTDFGKLSWAWRSTGLKDTLGRSLPLILLAATFSVATVLVGIFSSYVVDGTDIQVLVNSPHCGGFNMDYSSRVAIDANYTPIVSELALAITQDCYNTDQNLNSARCRIYSKPRITLQSAREKCPWPSPMCTEKTEKPAITLDSGLLDVGDTFGINLPSGENIKFRRRTSCAVLPLENRTSVIPATKYPQSLRPLLPEEQFLIMSYGRYGEPAQKEDWLNATFVISLATTNVSDTFMVRKVNCYNDAEWFVNSAHTPLPPLKRNDSDLSIKLVLKNAVVSDYPIDDPVFSAHKPIKLTEGETQENITKYLSDFPATAIGCTKQYQFCVNTECTELRHLPRDIASLGFNGITSLQSAVLNLLVSSAFMFDVSTSKTTLAGSIIQIGGVLSSLPDDQWVKEVVSWESNAWAALQIAVADYAIGAANRDTFSKQYVKEPSSEGEKKLCGMQKMRKSGGFVNINVFGLTMVCFSATFIITFNTLLLRFFAFLSTLRRTRWLGPRIERWVEDGVLQLQRRTFEAEGRGMWRGLESDIPTTKEATVLSYNSPWDDRLESG